MAKPNQSGKRKRWTRYVFPVMAGMLIGDVVWVQWDRRITIGHETTRITAPVVAGYPDYLAAMNLRHSAGVTAENNAAPGIIAIVGLQETPEIRRHAVYAQWGISEAVGGKPPYRSFSAWMKDQGEARPAADSSSREDPFEKEADAAAKGPWSRRDHARLAQWLEAMAPALAALDEACRRPKFYFPLVLEDGRVSAPAEPALVTWNGALGSMRALARTVIVRAMLRLHEGDIEGFQRDIFLTMRLSRLLAQQPTLIENFVAQAIDSYALRSVQLAAAHSLDGAAAQSLRRDIDKLAPLPAPAHAIDEAERYMALSLIFSWRKATRISLIPVHYDAALRRANHFFDRTLEAYALPTEPERHDALERLSGEVEALVANASTWHLAMHGEDLLFALGFSSLAKIESLQTVNLVDRDLALTSLALRQAKARDGVFPVSLADLRIPGFSAPADRFSEKPLVYQRKGDGYVLYSVGYDLEDNGGIPRPEASEASTPKKWDIVVESAK